MLVLPVVVFFFFLLLLFSSSSSLHMILTHSGLQRQILSLSLFPLSSLSLSSFFFVLKSVLQGQLHLTSLHPRAEVSGHGDTSVKRARGKDTNAKPGEGQRAVIGWTNKRKECHFVVIVL